MRPTPEETQIILSNIQIEVMDLVELLKTDPQDASERVKDIAVMIAATRSLLTPKTRIRPKLREDITDLLLGQGG